MKTTITKQELTSGLSFIAGIPRRTTVPILQNVLIKKTGSTMEFIARDIETQATAYINTSPNGDFAFTCDYDRINKVVSNLPDDAKVTLEIDDGKITIKSGRSKFAIQTLPAADFPMIESGDSTGSLKIKQEDFKRMLQSVSKTMATKDVRYQLNGVFFEVQNNTLSMVSSNGSALALETMPIEFSDCGYIIPAANVARLVKSLGNGDVTITFYANRLKFEINGNEIISNMIDAKYPDYRRVIPQNLAHSIEINTKKFIGSINRAAVSANEKHRAIRISFGKQMVFAGANGIEESSDSFDIEYDGADFDAGFNVDYLINATFPIDSEKMTLRFLDALSPVMVESGLYKCVVMPMRI